MKKRAELKKAPLGLNEVESMMTFETAKGFVAQMAALTTLPVTAIGVMQKAAGLSRDEALGIETKAFVGLIKSPAAEGTCHCFFR